MLLNRLDLLKYGAFNGRSLTFRNEAKLHLIFGPNEAGKSSTLAAVSDLLFGFPSRTPFDFRFKTSELRLGGEVVSKIGKRLAFVRRKGNSKTLLDLEGNPIDDNVLGPYLGPMTPEIFRNAFGLDAEKLRSGAEELIQARGELGSSLMAAASGIIGLTRLQTDIDGRADKIFTPAKSQSRAFYQARERYEAAKKAILEKELRVTEWRRLNDTVVQNEKRLAELSIEIRKSSEKRTRIERLKRLAPLLRRIDANEQALALYADIPNTPLGYAAQLDEALTSATTVDDTCRRLQTECDDTKVRLAEISFDTTLLGHAVEVEALIKRISEAEKDASQLPRIAAELESANADLATKARALGLKPDQNLELLQPSDADLALLRSLIEEERNLKLGRSTFESSLKEERENIGKLDALNQNYAGRSDPAPFNEQWRALDLFKAISEHEQKAIVLRRDEEALDRESIRLQPPVTDLLRLQNAPLPTTETITKFEKEFNDTEATLRDCERRIIEIKIRIKDLRQRLDVLMLGGDVPTPELITQTRATRDKEWILLRITLFGETGALEGTHLANSVTRFERSGENVDRLSDAAVHDAGKVSNFTAHTIDLKAELKALADLENQLAEQNALKSKLAEDWAALWTPLAVTPLHPQEMRNWRATLDSLLDRFDRQKDLRHEVQSADDRLASLVSPLSWLAKACGLSEIPSIDVEQQGKRIELRLVELAKDWEDIRLQTHNLNNIGQRITRLETDLASHANKEALWTQSWRSAVSNIGLSQDAISIQAQAALDIWKLIPADLKNRDQLKRRVDGIRRDITRFEDEARSILLALVPDLVTLPPTLGIAQLGKRLEKARDAYASSKAIADHLRDCETKLRAAQNASAEARDKLGGFTAEIPPCHDLKKLQDNLAQREAIWVALADLRSQFIDQSDGFEEVKVRCDLEDFNCDQAEADLEELEQQNQRSVVSSNETYAAVMDAKRQIDVWAQGLGSEEASQQRVNAESEMQEVARNWLVLRLAGSMLNDAIKRHADTRQDPLIQRASSLFATLTGGLFSGIDQPFDEDGRQTLQGLRDSGEHVEIYGLSEGTRDQLYLALRLAYVEDYSNRNEPIPFIADDLFTTFDDVRTAHGLRVLADVGTTTQCVLFTHHRHVVEIARASLGAELDLIEI
jgi:uncharacterized protein YhaN